MDLVLDVLKFGLYGLLALFGLAVVFGKRVEKKWEYEAKFRDARGRELGEFDLELSRVPKESADWTLHAKFVLRHPDLVAGRVVRVSLEGEPVFEAVVQTEGRIRLGVDDLCGDPKSAAAGQIVSVRCGDVELFAEALYRD